MSACPTALHYHCEFCDETFETKDKVAYHMMNEHIWNNKALYDRYMAHRKKCLKV